MWNWNSSRMTLNCTEMVLLGTLWAFTIFPRIDHQRNIGRAFLFFPSPPSPWFLPRLLVVLCCVLVTCTFHRLVWTELAWTVLPRNHLAALCATIVAINYISINSRHAHPHQQKLIYLESKIYKRDHQISPQVEHSRSSAVANLWEIYYLLRQSGGDGLWEMRWT